jgi:hypothetical protein
MIRDIAWNLAALERASEIAPPASRQETHARIIQRFGYLVAQGNIPLRIGQLLPPWIAGCGEPAEQKWRVVAEAKEKEYIRQCKFAGWSYETSTWSAWDFYHYRVEKAAA